MFNKGKAVGVVKQTEDSWTLDVDGIMHVHVHVDPLVPEGTAADGTPICIRLQSAEGVVPMRITYYVRTKEDMEFLKQDILAEIGKMNAKNGVSA